MHQVPKTMRDVSRGALSSITCDECQSSHLNMVRMRWLVKGFGHCGRMMMLMVVVYDVISMRVV